MIVYLFIFFTLFIFFNAFQAEGSGTLKVSGFVRGKSINVNSLIHIPGWGNFQLSQIDYPADPFPGPNRRSAGESVSITNFSNFKNKVLDLFYLFF